MMKKIPPEVYQRINNSFYNSDLVKWWDKDSPLNLIESILNPVRIKYFKRILNEIHFDAFSKKALEVGCGGGILSEAIARMGFMTTGIDPSSGSIQCAGEHSNKEGLMIKYLTGSGEEIPFQNKSFDVIFCCDVLEHVRDLPKVISEISRVLKHGGIFFYDTINRTFLSKMIVIKILQEWEYFSVLPDNLHVWEMFIRPEEMKRLLFSFDLQWVEHRGIVTCSPNPGILKNLHKRASGKLSCEDFSKVCRLKEGSSLQVSYMGYAIKK